MSKKGKNQAGIWTSKEVLKNWPVPTTVLTMVFTYLINFRADAFLTYLLNINSNEIFTRNYTFGMRKVLFVIPAVFISLWVMKKLLKDQPLPNADEDHSKK